MHVLCDTAKLEGEREDLENLLSREKAEVSRLQESVEQLNEQQARLTQEKQQLVTKVRPKLQRKISAILDCVHMYMTNTVSD